MRKETVQSTITRTPAGTYKLRWRDKGINVQRTTRTKEEALQLQREMKRGEYPEDYYHAVRLRDFSEIWIARHCRLSIEGSTAHGYMLILKNSILPYFGKKVLQDIDEDDVLRYREWLKMEKGYKAGTIGSHLRLLKLMFNCACIWRDKYKRRYLNENPAASVKTPRVPETEPRFWTADEIICFLTYTQERAPQVYEIAALTLATGLRRGELHELRVDALDFENRQIIVKRAFSFATRKAKTTKSRRIRRIPMNAEVFEILSRYQGGRPHDRIFEGVNIEHFHKPLGDWCKKAGVTVIGLHDLRATFASSLVRGGKRVKVVQALMGHCNTSVTERYMHLDPYDLVMSTECLLTGVGPHPLGAQKNVRESDEKK